MVRTRSTARGFLFDQLSQEQQYQLEDLARQAGFNQDDNNSQSYSQENSYDFDASERHESSNTDTGRPTYRPGDQCKRHRVRDNEPYSVEVISYRRRKPH